MKNYLKSNSEGYEGCLEAILAESIKSLKGIGAANAAKFAKLGIFTVGQLLEHYPRRYEDRSQLKLIKDIELGLYSTFEAKVIDVRESKPNKSLTITKILAADASGKVTLTWFNQPYLKNKYALGTGIIVSGKVQKKFHGLEINTPDVELSSSYNTDSGRIVPVYPACEEIGQWQIRSLVRQSLDILNAMFAESNLNCQENLPPQIIKEYNLLRRHEALNNIHFPKDTDTLKKARYTLVFEELYLLQRALLYLKHKNKHNAAGIKHGPDGKLVFEIEKNLPFDLTNGQKKAIAEVKADMEDVTPMQRLIQGDVGSGKTIVAAVALAKTVENGYQGAMMAPTEVLAEQHYKSLSEIFSKHGVKLALLTGKFSVKTRKEILERISSAQVDIVIGTHALIQESVSFKHLGLVITDEQHRFGVRQRAKLQGKGLAHTAPDVLVMTATPIPRTMALTVYGDLDVSLIKDLPPGRKPIATFVRSGERREKVYQFAAAEIKSGRQVYVVCPLVEESEKIEAESAIKLYNELASSYFKNELCGLIHGRMKSAEKEAIMNGFYLGEIKVLVATTVIEVGVNVPNATIMIIEGAERFGLAQLHQLRGRVGRGVHKSYCILLSDSKNKEALDRLKILSECSDGFVLAEKDLILRGPGQFFGTNQHGLPDLKISNIIADIDILLSARRAAIDTVNSKAKVV